MNRDDGPGRHSGRPCPAQGRRFRSVCKPTLKLELYADWVLALERMHVLRMLDPTMGSAGLFKGERVISVLRDLIGDCDIETLPIIGQGSYGRRILQFVESVRPARAHKEPSRGLLDVAFTAMQTMQDTIADRKISACPPDVIVEIPRNACGFFEFWRAEALIALGRERAARALAGETR